jgi:hypothetical protein
MASMRNATKLLVRAGWMCVGSLASATLFCVGCSIHETNRWGQPQDGITHLLASGTYLSLFAFAFSIFALIAAIVSEK